MANILMDYTRYGPPAASVFTNTYGTNSENPTKTDTTGRGLLVSFGSSPAGGDNLRGFTKAKASSTNYDLIARIAYTTGAYNYNCAALAVSDGTKFVTFSWTNINGLAGAQALKVVRWNTTTSFNSDRYVGNTLPMAYEWLRIEVVSGDPKNFYISENGVNWIEVFTESQTGFLTYTQVGVMAQVTRSSGTLPVASTPQHHMNILYFKDPDVDPGF